MDFSWISLLFLTFIWTAVVHIYEPPAILWLPMITASIIFSFIGFKRKSESDCVSSGKDALKYCASVILAQGAVFPFYYIWAARHHAESLFATIASGVLNLIGVRTVCEDSLLYIDSFSKTVVFSSTWEKTGAIYIVLFAVGGVITLLLKKASAKDYAVFFSVTFLYAVIRYVFLITLYITYSLHSVFWERIITFFTFVPYSFLLTAIFRKLPIPTVKLQLKGIAKPCAVITGILAFLLIFSGVSFFGFRDLGKEKQGRVLVDEYHSDWEWTTDAYDEQWFGERSGYNYYCFFNFLNRYYDTDRNMSIIDDKTLRNVDVFIMKTPTKPFSEEEIGHITAFVEGGGGLYLLGDHTNVFGTGVNLNQISKSFGITFNYDCTYELTEGSLSEYNAPTLMPHPVVSAMPHFLFATSDTLDAKWQAEEVMTGYGLKNLKADYSQKNFFPSDTNDPTLEFGLFLQSASVQYGKGRVLAFTDSTVFSNFWMLMPGKPELLLGSVEWLNRENSIVGVAPREITAVFFILMLILNLVWGIKNKREYPSAIFVLAGASAFLISSGLFHAVGKVNGQLPYPIRPMVNIRFEQEYSRFKLPADLDGFMSNMDELLNTFYVWTQRIDYFPGVDKNLLGALQNGSLAVMAKPDREIQNPKSILDEIHAGAKLLILDNITSGGSSNSLLKMAGMELVNAEMAQYADYGEIKDIPLTSGASAVVGGDALIIDRNGNTTLAIQKLGDGFIAVFSDPDLFYNYELGDVSANLTDKTKILTNMEFKMLRELIEKE